jgi:saccharopine dehydrogenase-like NADP-dependent oxidoreductase
MELWRKSLIFNMKILLFGAGKSATSLIRYLVDITAARGWQLIVAESNRPLAESKLGNAPHARVEALDVSQEDARDALVASAGIVISLLPPTLHYLVALSCLKKNKNLLTASYLDPSIGALQQDVSDKGLLFLCEMGLDPGIDHMSALQLITRIKAQHGRIHSFYSHTGGLVAPSCDDNPWHYKISWNPRNVVLAGSAGAAYREAGKTVRRSYAEIFQKPGLVSLPGVGDLAWYPNRDSLSYIPLYGLEEARTFIRTTLRYPAYCNAWAAIVGAGLTDDRKPLNGAPADLRRRAPDASPADAARRPDQGPPLTCAEWSAPLLPLVNDENRPCLEFLGLFDKGPIPTTAQTSADVLQHLLETRLAMQPADKDMIAMIHEIGYTRDGESYTAQSSLIIEGEDSWHTAMARTVGLPLGIAAILVLDGRIPLTGVHIPILPLIYEPVLEELEKQGIRFTHTNAPLIHLDG